MRPRQFCLPGKKQLVQGFGCPKVAVVDVTETPIERPKRHTTLSALNPLDFD